MCHLPDDLSVETVEWNYFAAGHGKGAVDAIGGQVKRMVWTAVKSRHCTVQNAEEFFKVAEAQCKSTEVLFVTKKETEETSVFLNKRWEYVRTAPGILEIHHIKKIDDVHVAVGLTSKSVKQKVQVAFPEIVPHSMNSKLRWRDVYSSDSGSGSESYSDDDDDASVENNINELGHTSKTEELDLSELNVNIVPGVYVEVCITGHGKTQVSHNYVAVCQTSVLQNSGGDLRVIFLKQYGKTGNLFVPNEEDEKEINIKQVVCILPNPTITKIGSRVIYDFKNKICL